MANDIHHVSLVKDGKFSPMVSNNIKAELARFEGKKVEIIIKKLSAKRSLEQNALIHVYFTLLKDALNDLGNDFSMLKVKRMMKQKFLTIDVIDMSTGEVIGNEIRDTHTLNKVECGEFIDNMIQWSAELGIILPMRESQQTLI
jgi:hypothetical protein